MHQTSTPESEDPLSTSESLAPFVEAGRRFLPEVLIDRRSWAAVRSVADRLPGTLARSALGFELRLGAATAETDLWLILTAGSGAREELCQFLAGPGQALLEHAPWKSLHRFFRAWAQPSHRLHRGVSMTYLEFDLAGREPGVPLPNLWVSPAGDALSTTGVPGRRRPPTVEQYWQIIAESQNLLRGYTLPEAPANAFRACLRALPEGVPITYAGFMLARPGHELRLRLSQPTAEQTLEILRQLEWPGPEEELAAVLAELAPDLGLSSLLLDLDEGLRLEVGLECHAGFGSMAEMRLSWGQLLDRFVRRGWCLPEKRAALLAYLGLSQISAEDPACPALTRRHLGERPELIALLERSLSLVKLTWSASGNIVAKAYPAARFGFGLRPASAARRRG